MEVSDETWGHLLMTNARRAREVHNHQRGFMELLLANECI